MVCLDERARHWVGAFPGASAETRTDGVVAGSGTGAGDGADVGARSETVSGPTVIPENCGRSAFCSAVGVKVAAAVGAGTWGVG